jgi:Bacterial Ig domain
MPRSVALALGLILVGQVFAAFSGIGLAWDGGYYLFKLLDTEAPFIAHERVVAVAIQWPILWAQHFTRDVTVLAQIFGLAYTAPVLLALGADWYIVRHHRPELFVWPLLGTALVSLPGRAALVSEAFIAVDFFWPLLLLVLTTRYRHGRARQLCLVAIAALTLVLAATHPLSSALLGIVALGAVLKSARFWRGWPSLALPGFVLAVAFARPVFIQAPYDADALTAERLGAHLVGSVGGWPLLILLAAYAVASALRWDTSDVRTAAPRRVALVALVAAGIAGVVWAADSAAWHRAYDFRTWLVVAMMPIAALCIDEGRRHRLPLDTATIHLRSVAGLGAAAVFAVVMVIQGSAWMRLQGMLTGALSASPVACSTVQQMRWTWPTALNHWGITALSLVLQGNAPRYVLLYDGDCESVFDGGSITLLANQVVIRRDRTSGWFDLSRAGASPPVFSRSTPVGHLDLPADGALVRGSVQIAGWAADRAAQGSTGVDRVLIYLDGILLGPARLGQPRPDVAEAIGTETLSASGFNYRLDATTLSPGPHTLEVRSHSAVSQMETTYTRTVVVTP